MAEKPRNSNPLAELSTNLMGPKHDDHEKQKMLNRTQKCASDGKENQVSIEIEIDIDENEFGVKKKKKNNPDGKLRDNTPLKPTSLQLCMKMNEPDSSFGPGFGFGFKIWDSAETESAKSVNVWDYSDSEAAPASSWSTVPNRALLCRPLSKDIGSCSCIIVKEAAPDGFGGGSLYSLYTNEGKGRQNRKLAVAHHKRRKGRSSFTVAQNPKGVLSTSDDSFIGLVRANLIGSRYYIWDQEGHSTRTLAEKSKLLQGFVEFTPTISSWTGRYRSIKAWISKQQPLQLKNTSKNQYHQVQNAKRVSLDLEEHKEQAHLLLSRVPKYNKMSKKYELDFRDKVRSGFRIQRSVKNFQLTMEGNGKQTILQLGRVGKSKYVLDYKHPLSGYQAFCICLASIDPKLCCTV